MARFTITGNGEPGPQGPAGADATLGVETSFVVNGGTTGAQPTFNGAPLFSGSYVKNESLVYFQIQVDFDNIISFGTGTYFVDLPLPSKHEIVLRDGCVHDVAGTVKNYHISGQVAAGSDRMFLYSSVKDGNSVEDVPFTHNSIFTLSVEDNFHIAGTYIADTVAPL
jgi:hypothetical protein